MLSLRTFSPMAQQSATARKHPRYAATIHGSVNPKKLIFHPLLCANTWHAIPSIVASYLNVC